ncbi:hypothetical protein Taro_050948 [Colocasia esculenta]|uniref:Glycosyltransferase 61 catalytic domain-containing protein n=1 Tax=Colocasia esculenta TaxID=4460 RepID=A0A843XFH2_COLES|nr:hypothetical protein [Colocasia esculenta]
MKPFRISTFGRHEPKKMGSFLVIVCVALSLTALSLIKTRFCSAPNVVKVPQISVSENLKIAAEVEPPLEDDDEDDADNANIVNANAKGEHRVVQVSAAKPICVTTGKRSDTCEVDGDVRVHANSTTIFFVRRQSSSSSLPSNQQQQEWRIRPYARKGSMVQAHVKEWTVKMVDPGDASLPACTKTHAVPAVVFSVGGFTGNLFHDFTDVLVPLFVSAHQFGGEVQLLVSDTKPWWVGKFLPVLKQLSRHKIVDADNDEEGARCFPRAVLGPAFHKEIGVDASLTPGGYGMAEFREAMARAFGLRRRTAGGTARPRLLIISRRHSRAFLNERGMGEMARSLGYEVVAVEPDAGTEVGKVARVVNTADVMVGVHGAGLTNMVFLPEGAVVVQVIPLGGLEWLARDSFREPAGGMGLKYLEYRIREEESSLAEQYPGDHPVLRNPMAVHQQGWGALKSVYLDNQNVRPHLSRLRKTLLEARQLLPPNNFR